MAGLVAALLLAFPSSGFSFHPGGPGPVPATDMPRRGPAPADPAAVSSTSVRPAQTDDVHVLVVPANACGSSPVQIGSQSYGNGSVASLDPTLSPYSVLIPPVGFCSGVVVSYVRAGPSPALTLEYPTSLPGISFSASLAVAGNGTLMVQFQVPVQVAWSPGGCGPLSFNGTFQGNTSLAFVFPGTYQSSLPCTGHSFVGWTTKGSVSVVTPSSPTSEIVVSAGGGDLWENFSTQGPPTNGLQQYTVALQIVPSTCGPLTFNGNSYGSGATGVVTYGTYTVTAPTCQGYTFSSWTTTGSLVPEQPSSITSSVLVQGNGTLTLTYVAASGGPGPGSSPPGGSSFTTSEAVALGLGIAIVVAVALVLFVYVRRRRPSAGTVARPGPRETQQGAPGASASWDPAGPPSSPSISHPRPTASGPAPPRAAAFASLPAESPGRASTLPYGAWTGPSARGVGPVWRASAPLSVYEGADEEQLWSMVRASGIPSSKVLGFTRLVPSEVVARYGLQGATMMRISRVEGENVVAPTDLEKIGYLAERHMTTGGRAVVLPGIGFLVDANSVKNVGRLLEVLRDVAQGAHGAVLVSLDPRTLDASKVALLEGGAQRI